MAVSVAPRLINHTFPSPLRYPGGKGSHTNFIKQTLIINKLLDCEYVEVYGGGASIAWGLLFDEFVSRVHVNDIDPRVMTFWRCVVDQPDELCRLIWDTPVTMEVWHRQQNIRANPDRHSPLEVAFSTFFLNRTNRSGILRGGVIGGLAQTGKWPIDARFHKQDLTQRILRIARYASRISLHQLDAAEFINGLQKATGVSRLIYLDPPYFKKGRDLYENHYQESDHESIAGLVAGLSDHWIVSYDAAPQIMKLYQSWPHIRYDLSYSAQGHYEGTEVMFYDPRLRMPDSERPTLMRRPRVSGLA